LKRRDVRTIAPRTLEDAGGRCEREMRRGLRHGHDFAAHAREHYAGLRGSTAPRVAGPTRLDQRRGFMVLLAEQSFHGGAQLARDADRDCDAGMVGAGLDRTQRLPRDASASRQLCLGEVPRRSRVDKSFANRCHNTCQLALKMAYGRYYENP
jgi:hypothetical protein